ncbi:SPOR domain-containing protein [Pseudomonas sp. JM0905a]|uniref:SPOR domain-containing protein n=1 Tax=Metapseudomonas resinovorans TaxID=53412 RepID=A0ABT4Y6W8_METRE|nr:MULTISPECIES: SPOR domain-containing protein [Pseudomonas]MBD2837350.1 SPOR domain-containing protein [Pseudomonas sp. JM0905a]MDA8484528.1 SPOR domain-containing protein [Pseudomonas resinovorans]
MAKKKPAPKRGASRYQAPAKKPVPGWVWLAIGLVIGGFVVFLNQLEPGRDEVRRTKPEQATNGAASGKANSDAGKAQVKPATPPAQEPAKPKYDFYTLLPESEVIVPPEAVPKETPATPPAQKPVTPEEAAKIDAARAQAALNGETPPPAPPVVAKAPVTNQFFLQAGSFRKRDDADRVRAQIILLGQNVQVESGTVREETWYRVLVGPFANREQLASAQKQLAGSGFSNLLLQQRQSR